MEAILKRDRNIALSAILAITFLAWLYMARMAAEVEHGAHGLFAHNVTHGWDLWNAGLLIVMWTVMMTGMMLPSATPYILAFAATNRRCRESGGPFVATSIFVLGYLAAWTAFSVAAAGVQWILYSASLLSTEMSATTPLLGGGLLIAAGLYQWSALKHNCLAHCRSPMGFLMTQWREGRAGAFVMGLKHGVYCVGCCWALMALLFVAGVMNILWGAVITIFVLIEKVSASGERISKIAAVVLIATGIVVVSTG